MSPPGIFPTTTQSPDSLSSARGSDSAKPCRTCTDFKTWAKLQTSQTSGTSDSKTVNVHKASHDTPGHRTDCPMDKDELGHSTWSYLHTMAAYYPDKPTKQEQKEMASFIDIFTKFYPCDTCAKDFRNEITGVPPQVESQQKFTQWLCVMHNKVNKKLGKPIFDCSKVNERWRDGWIDGSCD